MNVHLVRTYCASGPKRPETKSAIETAVGVLNRMAEAGAAVGKNSLQKISATGRNWWDKYEEFVGLNEVREAQGKVTEVNVEIMQKNKIENYDYAIRRTGCEAEESLQGEQCLFFCFNWLCRYCDRALA